MPGDTEVKPIENEEPKAQPVLSQESEQKDQVPKTEIKDPEVSKRNYENMHRRLQMKSWRQQAQAIENDTTIAHQAVENAARNRGFDTKNEDNQKQVGLLGDALSEERSIRSNKIKDVKVKAANDILANTLESIGYERNSEGFNYAGQLLFKKFGTTDPDVYEDVDKMNKEIESLTALIQPKKRVDSLSNALINKASAPSRSSESRTASATNSKASEVKSFAQRSGLSEEKAAKILELKNKQPSYLKEKNRS